MSERYRQYDDISCSRRCLIAFRPTRSHCWQSVESQRPHHRPLPAEREPITTLWPATFNEYREDLQDQYLRCVQSYKIPMVSLRCCSASWYASSLFSGANSCVIRPSRLNLSVKRLMKRSLKLSIEFEHHSTRVLLHWRRRKRQSVIPTTLREWLSITAAGNLRCRVSWGE